MLMSLCSKFDGILHQGISNQGSFNKVTIFSSKPFDVTEVCLIDQTSYFVTSQNISSYWNRFDINRHNYLLKESHIAICWQSFNIFFMAIGNH